jgi:hypothetical protein
VRKVIYGWAVDPIHTQVYFERFGCFVRLEAQVSWGMRFAEEFERPGATACITTRVGPVGEEDLEGTPDGDKAVSSGTTSDGSWRVVRLRAADSDWAEVPLEQGSRPSSPGEQPAPAPGEAPCPSIPSDLPAGLQRSGIWFSRVCLACLHLTCTTVCDTRVKMQGR